MSMIRTRWAAIGAAVAVTLGGGGLFVANAADSTSDSLFHPVTPVRVMDTRVGGTAVVNTTVKLDLEGTIGTYNANGSITNSEVVPDSATSVAINLTVTGGLKNGDYGFVTAFPCTATTDTPPTASSLNFENRVDIANALNVTTSSSGEVCFNVYGTAHLIVDVAGYYDDSRIDAIETDISANDSRIDAIETDTSANDSRIDSIETDISAIENDYVDNDSDITFMFPIYDSAYNLLYGGTISSDLATMQVDLVNGVGAVGFDIPAFPSSMGQLLYGYRLKSVQICIPANGNAQGGYISDIQIHRGGTSTQMYDFTPVASSVWGSSADCETWTIPTDSRVGSNVHRVAINISDASGTDGDVSIQSVRATFEPYSTIALPTPGFGF